MFRLVASVLAAVALVGCATTSVDQSGPLSRDVPVSVGRSPLTEPPGAYFAEVTQDTIQTTICVPGWTATVRPSTTFTYGLRITMLRRAGLQAHDASKYELDHFVPLALGGHPRSEDNLWLQPWNSTWNAKTKDRLERKLQVLVCAGQLTLHASREAIQKGWRTAYRKFVGADPSAVLRELAGDDDEVVE